MCRIHKVGLLGFVFLIIDLRIRLVEGGVSAMNNRNDNIFGHPYYYRNALRNRNGYIAHRGSRTRYRQHQLIRSIIQQYAKALQGNIHTQSLFHERTAPMSEARRLLQQHNYGQWARNVMKNYEHALIFNATSMTLFPEPTKKLIRKHPNATPSPLVSASGTALGGIVRTFLSQNVTIHKQKPTIVPDSGANASTTLYPESAISLDTSTAPSAIQNNTDVTATATSNSENVTTTVKIPTQTSVHSQDLGKETSFPVNKVIKPSFGKDSTSVKGAYRPLVTGSNMSPTTKESFKKTTPFNSPLTHPTDTTSIPEIVTHIKRNVPTKRPDLYDSSIDGTPKTDINVAITQELVIDMGLNNETIIENNASSANAVTAPLDENITSLSMTPSLLYNGTTKSQGVVMNGTTTSADVVMNETTKSTGSVINWTTNSPGVVMNATTKSAGVDMSGSNKPTVQTLDKQNRTEIGTGANLETSKDLKKPVFARMIQTIDTKGKTAKDQCGDVCAIIGICQNGATCVSKCDGMGFMCSCLPGFSGYFCDKIMK